jgi:hypothetical protein
MEHIFLQMIFSLSERLEKIKGEFIDKISL